MSEKSVSSLIEKYPVLFEHLKSQEAEQEPLTLFGIECGDGWRDILDILFSTLLKPYRDAERVVEYHTKKQLQQNDEESKIELQNSLLKLEHLKNKLPRFTQIKEKFGTLRIYYDNISPEVDNLVSFAEMLSEVTCEVCGSPGRLNRGGWLRVLCDQHTPSKNGIIYWEDPKTAHGNNYYFAGDGSYGSSLGLVVADTSKWTDADWDKFDEVDEAEYPSLALDVCKSKN